MTASSRAAIEPHRIASVRSRSTTSSAWSATRRSATRSAGDIIELKRARRVSVGPEVTFVFENHDTVYFQIQEMLRAERITDLDAVRAELEVYNALLPAARRAERDDADRDHRAKPTSPRDCSAFLGIDEAVALKVGTPARIAAEFEPGRSKEDKLSAVQYVRFSLPPAARAAFADPAVPVAPRRSSIRTTGHDDRDRRRDPRVARAPICGRRMNAARDTRSSPRSTTRCAASHDHPTAEQVFQRVRGVAAARQPGHRLPQPRQAARAGPPARRAAGGRQAHYDAMVDAHDHFVCERCGAVRRPRPPAAHSPDVAPLRAAATSCTGIRRRCTASVPAPAPPQRGGGRRARASQRGTGGGLMELPIARAAVPAAQRGAVPRRAAAAAHLRAALPRDGARRRAQRGAR